MDSREALFEEYRKANAEVARLSSEINEIQTKHRELNQARNDAQTRIDCLRHVIDDVLLNGTDPIQAKLMVDNDQLNNSTQLLGTGSGSGKGFVLNPGNFQITNHQNAAAQALKNSISNSLSARLQQP